MLTPNSLTLEAEVILMLFAAGINGRGDVVSQLGFRRLEADFGSRMSCSLALLVLWAKELQVRSQEILWCSSSRDSSLVNASWSPSLIHSHTWVSVHAQTGSSFFPCLVCIHLAFDAGVHLIDSDVPTSLSSRQKFHVETTTFWLHAMWAHTVALSGRGARKFKLPLTSSHS